VAGGSPDVRDVEFDAARLFPRPHREQFLRYLARIARLSLLIVACLVGTVATADAAPIATPATTGWRVTVYYTAVERFHTGPLTAVTGCPVQDCEQGHDALGSYPRDFVQAVQDEGTGRITSGPHAGRYLNWSEGTGYWLDRVPADARGQRLVPWSSAAVDSTVATFGAAVRVLGCGRDAENGDSIDTGFCHRLIASRWTVRDRFTAGLGGRRHIDLYIGEEDQRGFADRSPKVVDTAGARVQVSH
jgi:hypothetical protein